MGVSRVVGNKNTMWSPFECSLMEKTMKFETIGENA